MCSSTARTELPSSVLRAISGHRLSYPKFEMGRQTVRCMSN